MKQHNVEKETSKEKPEDVGLNPSFLTIRLDVGLNPASSLSGWVELAKTQLHSDPDITMAAMMLLRSDPNCHLYRVAERLKTESM